MVSVSGLALDRRGLELGAIGVARQERRQRDRGVRRELELGEALLAEAVVEPPLERAQLAYTSWPAYRVSQGELRTFQWRLNDCFRQQRFPELQFTSDASIALTAFIARNANGAEFKAPTIKR
jgi:hypothetical protein